MKARETHITLAIVRRCVEAQWAHIQTRLMAGLGIKIRGMTMLDLLYR